MVMKIEINKDFIESYLDFLNSLKKDNDYAYYPVKQGTTHDAINITLGLPFIRISPDHGPNQTMLGKNRSNPTSLLKAIQFLDKSWLTLKKV